MKTFTPLTVYSSLDLKELHIDDCEKHKGLTADHVVAATAFTVEERYADTKELAQEPARVAIHLLMDKETVSHEHLQLDATPELLSHIYDRFHDLMCNAFGNEHVNLSLLQRLLTRFGAEVVDEDEDNITLGMRRGDESPLN